MNKVYSRIIWKNYPNTSTAINETNLNRMDKAIDDLDNRVIEQDSTKADQTTVNNMVKNWTMDETTGVITVEKQDGSKIMFDLNIEKIPVDFEMSPSGILTMTTSDGTQFTANIGSMIPVLTFNESDQIAVSVSGSGVNKTYSFSIKDNSITERKLQPNFLADIKVQSANASLSANNAETSATQAQSYAIGGTGTRENEDTDNAMYYYEQAKQTDIGQISSKVDEINSKLSKQLGNHTVKSDVPENAVFTDTVYDDTEVQKRISDIVYNDGSLSNNIMGTDSNIYYCPLENNSIITISKKNIDDTFPASPQDKILRIHQCNSDGTIIESWQIYDSLLPRTISIIKPSNYLKFSHDISDKPLMVNFGKSALPYEPYIPSNKMLAEENSLQSTEMMDIKMLGWSVPKECPIQNEVNGNQFVQKVGRADMSKLAWSTYSSAGIFRFSSESRAEYTKYNIKQGSFAYLRDYNYVGNSKSWSDISNYGNKTIMGVFVGGNDDGFILTNNSYTNSSDFKQAMQGQYLYYELATYNTITIDGNEEVVKVAEDVDTLKKETTVNLLNPTLQTATQNGVTCTNNGDGTYTLNGTASETVTFILTSFSDIKKTYRLCGCPKGGGAYNYYLDALSTTIQRMDLGEGTYIKQSDGTLNIRIIIVKGATVDNLVFKPMITTNLDATYDDFVQYTGDTGSLNGDVADLANFNKNRFSYDDKVLSVNANKIRLKSVDDTFSPFDVLTVGDLLSDFSMYTNDSTRNSEVTFNSSIIVGIHDQLIDGLSFESLNTEKQIDLSNNNIGDSVLTTISVIKHGNIFNACAYIINPADIDKAHVEIFQINNSAGVKKIILRTIKLKDIDNLSVHVNYEGVTLKNVDPIVPIVSE